jgi:hypothetical protein
VFATIYGVSEAGESDARFSWRSRPTRRASGCRRSPCGRAVVETPFLNLAEHPERILVAPSSDVVLRTPSSTRLDRQRLIAVALLNGSDDGHASLFDRAAHEIKAVRRTIPSSHQQHAIDTRINMPPYVA